VVPSVVLTLAWGGTFSGVLPLVTQGTAWDSVAASGDRSFASLRRDGLTARQDSALREHEQVLLLSATQARRVRYLAGRALPAIAGLALALLVVLAIVASRVAGHLSRQMSRPLDELVGWTGLIARGETVPSEPSPRGAPEFGLLRNAMRTMAAEIRAGRDRAVEAERLRAFREAARQVAHELKNPLTPIRFAVARLERDASPDLRESVEVIATESRRLEEMARSFAQFGRLPQGPAADVDIGELARYTATATVPATVSLTVEVDENVPMVHGHHDALARALSNVLLNAVDACPAGGAIAVRVRRAELPADPGSGRAGASEAVEIVVRDNGCGIPPERLARIWDPYVTHKAGGTGLGLAITRQAVLAHGGDVSATSEAGVGTEVRFILPVALAITLSEDRHPDA